MKRYLFFVVCWMIPWFGYTQPVQNDEVKLEKRMIQLGTVKSDTVIRRDFSFKNVSSREVKILDIEKSCQCLSAKCSDKIIGPQKTVKITLSVDTKGKTGDFEVNAVVILDTKQRHYLLRLKGRVERNEK